MLISLLLEAKRWGDVRTTIDALSETGTRAEALSMLASALAHEGFTTEADVTFTQARTAINAIVDEEARAEALYNLANALARAGRQSDAHATMEALPDDEDEDEDEEEEGRGILVLQTRSNSFVPRILSASIVQAASWGGASADSALSNVDFASFPPSAANLVMKVEQLQQTLATLIHSWRQARTRRELVKSFVINPVILARHPDIGLHLLASFEWVDTILRGEAPQTRKW
jgi:hypothetical protein